MTSGIQSGDTVQLKSGGARMVVLMISDDTALCEWQVGGRVAQGTFLLASLERVAGHQPPAPTAPPAPSAAET